MIDCQSIDIAIEQNYSTSVESGRYAQVQPVNVSENGLSTKDGVKLSYMNANVKCTGDKCFYIV